VAAESGFLIGASALMWLLMMFYLFGHDAAGSHGEERITVRAKKDEHRE
jgi:hypothetical protein